MNENPNELNGQQSASDWDGELAERIARRVRKVQDAKRSSAEEILAMLDGNAEVSADSEAEPAERVMEEEAYEAETEFTAVEETEKSADAEYAEEYTEEAAEPEYTEEAVAEEVPAVSEIPSHSAEEAAAVIEAAEEIPAVETEVKVPAKKKKKKKKKKTFGEKVRGLFPQKGDSVGECIRKIVFLISVVAIIVCGYIVGDYYLDLWRSSKINEDVMNMYWTYPIEKPEVPTVQTEGDEEPKKIYTLLDGSRKLLDINKDVVGVITIPDTPVNNPVMQAENNSKYLDRKIDGTEARNGELFLDYRNCFDKVENGELKYPNSDNLIIYGHNMKDDSMFGCLKYYERNYNYYEEHPIIYLNSNYECYTYKIFAFFIVDADDKSETKFDCWNKLNFDDEKDFYNYVNEAKRRTLRNTNVDVKYGDPLLTLSTCNTLLGDRGRLIILARQLREGEDLLEGTTDSTQNTNIKWPTMYYNSRPNEKYDPDAEFVPYGSEAKTTTTTTTATTSQSATATTAQIPEE